jgi:methyltransferase
MQIAWFAAMLAEVWGLHRPLIPVLAAIALLLTLLGQYLRYLSMQALGWRWTLTTMTVVGLPVVDTGIYRYLRHPSWLGVILEILGLPLIHGAYLTAIVFSVANAFLMVKRIQAEEQALSSESNYIEVLGDRPRFIPKVD